MTTQAMPLTRERPYGLYAICFGFFLVLLDTSALNVAIASIQHELGGNINGLQWVVNAYTLVFASLVLTSGALGDRYGAKRLYQVGLAIFTSMSLCCALSPSIAVLIAMRMFQGLGAAIMLPASLALLSHMHPNAGDRARAVSFWASIVSLGFAAGPALGGLLTNAFGWRSIFFLNVPVGIVAILMVHAFTEETRAARTRHIDWIGQASMSLALWAVSYGLIEAGHVGWSAPRVLGAFAACVVLAFTLTLAERRSTSPVLPPSLLARPAFNVCVAAGVLVSFATYGILFVESLHLQNVKHLSAFITGIMILPFSIAPTVTTRLLDRYRDGYHFKPRLIVGQVIAMAGALVLLASVRLPSNAVIIVGLALLGIALGYITPAITTGVLASSAAETAGVASGILNAGRQVGAAIGVALMGTLVNMNREMGMVISFVLVAVLCVALTATAERKIPHPV